MFPSLTGKLRSQHLHRQLVAPHCPSEPQVLNFNVCSSLQSHSTSQGQRCAREHQLLDGRELECATRALNQHCKEQCEQEHTVAKRFASPLHIGVFRFHKHRVLFCALRSWERHRSTATYVSHKNAQQSTQKPLTSSVLFMNQWTPACRLYLLGGQWTVS